VGNVVRFSSVWVSAGRIFVVLPILWGWLVDGWRLDRFDLLGATIDLVGVGVIRWERRWF